MSVTEGTGPGVTGAAGHGRGTNSSTLFKKKGGSLWPRML